MPVIIAFFIGEEVSRASIRSIKRSAALDGKQRRPATAGAADVVGVGWICAVLRCGGSAADCESNQGA